MTDQHGVKKNVLFLRKNQNFDSTNGEFSILRDSPLPDHERRKGTINCRSYLIGRAYDEPHGCCVIDNILLARTYIID